jgi:hypothetical protein
MVANAERVPFEEVFMGLTKKIIRWYTESQYTLLINAALKL